LVGVIVINNREFTVTQNGGRMNVNAKLRIGTQHHQAGRLKAAQVVYEEILDYFRIIRMHSICQA
jgi:hypothetical protein